MEPLQVPKEQWQSKPPKGNNNKSWKIPVLIVVLALIFGGAFLFYDKRDKESRKGALIQENKQSGDENYLIANEGNVSPLSGMACENWNRRAFAVMQPADASARPMAGFTEADLVFEMPAVYGSITRLMGVYICGNPEEIGSLRSARHDYIPIAAGLDAIYISFGASHFATDVLNKSVVDNINGLNAGGRAGNKYFFRKPGNWTKSEDNAYAKFTDLLQGAKDFEYRMETKFSGYPHQADAPLDQRPSGGHLRVGYPGAFSSEFDYDKETNSYLRTWGGDPDTDRNNGKRVAPKNIAVLIADGVSMEGQYANFQLGDPWYDEKDSGDATFYVGGQVIKGKWKKDKRKVDSKLLLTDENGTEIKFVPGQIWISVVDPGISVRWTPAQ